MQRVFLLPTLKFRERQHNRYDDTNTQEKSAGKTPTLKFRDHQHPHQNLERHKKQAGQ